MKIEFDCVIRGDITAHALQQQTFATSYPKKQTFRETDLSSFISR